MAISVDPEILIIDEALATGDVLFQEKCYKRIREITANGATVLFVTHSIATIFELCTRGILFHKGEIVQDDIPRRVGYAYEQVLELDRKQISHTTLSMEPTEEEEAGLRARMLSIDILNEEGKVVSVVWSGKTYTIRIRCLCLDELPSLNIAFRVQRANGEGIYGTNTTLQNVPISGAKGEIIELQAEFPCRFGPGIFLLGCAVGIREGNQQTELLHLIRGKQIFEVMSHGGFSGFMDLGLQIQGVRKYVNEASVQKEPALRLAS